MTGGKKAVRYLQLTFTFNIQCSNARLPNSKVNIVAEPKLWALLSKSPATLQIVEVLLKAAVKRVMQNISGHKV